MSQSEDFVMVDVVIYASDFVKETEKAWCFKVWGKKFIAFPKSILKNGPPLQSGGSYEFSLPVWFAREHSLKSLVVEDQRHLVKTKTELKKLEKERLQPNLLASVPDVPAVTFTRSAPPIEEQGTMFPVHPDDDWDW